jgi:ATP-dependent helicase/nuclease subunit A
MQEHWRLAYVGLTRAAERLVIAGVKPKRSIASGSWHSTTARVMEALGANIEEEGEWGGRLVWEGDKKAAGTPRAAKASLGPITLPQWIRDPAPVEARPPRPLAPSQIAEDKDAALPPTPEMRAAARRGTLLHSLFERLPTVEQQTRKSLALAWLEASGVPEGDREEIAEAACSVIGDPQFADVFSSQSLAEAPIAATLSDGRVVAGTVDRICIGEDLVKVVDFKTGSRVPADAASLPAGHRAQMEAYAEALSVIFPGRRVEAALLYTSGPKLIVLGG